MATISTGSSPNGTFSGADMIASIIFPGKAPITLGQVTTMTYSTYRETHPVRTLGRINVKGFSKGPRTIAGTIIFTVFEKHIVNQIKKEVGYIKGIRKLKPCELPPFDIMISFGNEYGKSAKLYIYGIEVVDEGKIFSVEDMFTENTWSYMARDIDLMDDIDAEQNAPLISLGELESAGKYNVSDLVNDDTYSAMQKEMAALAADKEAAVLEAREQAKEYISNVSTWKYEEPVVTIPGGDGIADNMPTDPGYVECHLPIFRVASKHGLIGTTDDVKQLHIKIVNKGAKEILRKVPLKLYWECPENSNKKEPLFLNTMIPDKAIESGGKSAEFTLAIGNYYSHKPNPPKFTLVPNVYEGINSSYKYTVKEHIIKESDGLNKNSPLVLEIVKVGSKEDIAAAELGKVTGEIYFSSWSKKINSFTNHSGGNYKQFIFRDATEAGYIGDEKNKFIIKNGDYITAPNTWIEQQRVVNVTKRLYTKGKNAVGVVGWDPNTRNYWLFGNFSKSLDAGFRVMPSLKKDGVVLPEKEWGNYWLRWNVKVKVNISPTEQITLTGDIDKNNNLVHSKLLPKYTNDLRSQRSEKLSSFDPNKIGFRFFPLIDMNNEFYTSRNIFPRDLIEAIYDVVHEVNGCKNVTHKSSPKKVEENCICDFNFGDMEYILYDFGLYDSKSGGNKIENIKFTGTNSDGELVFSIMNLDDRILKEIMNK